MRNRPFFHVSTSSPVHKMDKPVPRMPELVGEIGGFPNGKVRSVRCPPYQDHSQERLILLLRCCSVQHATYPHVDPV